MIPVKEPPKCWCGQPAHGEIPNGGKFRFWCQEHKPEHVRRFEAGAYAALMRGYQKRMAKLKAQDFWLK